MGDEHVVFLEAALVEQHLDPLPRGQLALGVLLTAISAAALNIFLPSLPSMTAHFDTDYRLMQLSVALYLAMNAVLQLAIGPISDRFGRRPVVLWAGVAFLVATLGCIWAPTAEVFLVFRMAQAVIVTGMVLSRAIVRDMVGEAEAASMIGYVTMGMAVVPMIGPAIGGVLDEAFGWQANFWLLFVLGAGVIALAWADQGETAISKPTSFARQFRDYPELFASPRFWGYALTAAFSSGAFFAYLGGAPYVGSEVYGLDPAMLGLFFGAPALGYMVGNFVSGRYSVRFGIDRMLLWGASLCATGLGVSLAIALMGLKTAPLFFAFMTFVGLGNGMVLPNAIAGTLSVRPHLAGTASGLGGAIMIGGGAALSALAGALLTGKSALPLQWIMFVSALAAVVCVRFVIWRARRVAARQAA
jgi:DHA1 family bicyclomycin/chloramphenicol resistance-like MFS transporter